MTDIRQRIADVMARAEALKDGDTSALERLPEDAVALCALLSRAVELLEKGEWRQDVSDFLRGEP